MSGWWTSIWPGCVRSWRTTPLRPSILKRSEAWDFASAREVYRHLRHLPHLNDFRRLHQLYCRHRRTKRTTMRVRVNPKG